MCVCVCVCVYVCMCVCCVCVCVCVCMLCVPVLCSLLPSGLLMICAYALRVLEWWYDGEGIALQSTVTLPPPPPPQRTMVS